MKEKCNVICFLVSVAFVATLVCLPSCEKGEDLEKQELSGVTELSSDNPETSALKCSQNSTLTGYEMINSMPQATIKTIVGPSFASLINYGVKMYKVSYRTFYNGKSITASGVIGIPDTAVNHNTKVVMYDHGTRITEADLLPSSGMDLISVVAAANGKICFAPDYIGFGDSKKIAHPFLISGAAVYPVCDMIVAGREFLSKVFNIMPKPSVTIFGFSQGANVTMSVQRELEQNPYYRHMIHLQGIALATGPYDLHNTVLERVSQETYSSPSLFVFAFISYNAYYHLGYDLNTIFKNSYGQQFLDMVALNKTSAQINAMLPVALADLFQDDFRADFLAKRTPFNLLFELNATYKGWVPKSPTRIYHSPADEIVPYASAQKAYNTFITAGSKSVELITLPPVNHVNSSFMAFADIIRWVDTTK